MDVTGEKIQKRRLLMRSILLAHGVLFFSGAAILTVRSGGVLVSIQGFPAFLFLLSSLALVVSACLFSYERQCQLVLLAVSASVSIYALEIGIRVLAPSLSPGEIKNVRLARRAQFAREEGTPFDTRTLLEVILDLRKEGTFVSPCGNFETYLRENIVTDDWFRYDNRMGIVRRSVIQINGKEVLPLAHPARHLGIGLDNENGHYVVFKTDEHGFRNPPGLWSLDEIDIVGLGDSFTEGSAVGDDEVFMSHIRKQFPRTLNLGIGGGGPFTMLACLREYGRVLKPKVTLWCFYEGNDILDLGTRMHFPILNDYLRRDFRQNLLGRQSELDAAIRTFLENAVQRQILLKNEAQRQESTVAKMGWANLIDKLVSVIVLEQICTKLGLRLNAELMNVALPKDDLVGDIEWASGVRILGEEHRAVFARILGIAKAEVESWGGKLYFVYLPSWDRVADPQFKLASTDFSGRNSSAGSRLAADPRSQVLATVRSLDISLIDLTDSFAQHEDPLSMFPFRQHGHYTPNGHQFVAEQIVRRLKSEPLLSDSSGR